MNKDILYIPPEFVPEIFNSIETYLQSGNDLVPTYSHEKHGCEQIISLLDRIQSDYYPDFFSKATYLFLSINKGHFFSNGNKRLAATFLKLFYTLNNYKVSSHPFPEAEIIIKSQLIKVNLIDNEFNKNFFKGDNQLEFLYAIALATARKELENVSFDVLKQLVETTLKNVLIYDPT